MIKKLLIVSICLMFSMNAIAVEQEADKDTKNESVKKSILCPLKPFRAADDNFKMDVLIKKSPLKKKKISRGGFIAPIMKYPIIGDYKNVFAGLRAAMILDHRLAIGITGNFMPTKTTNNELTGKNLNKKRVHWKYGGAYVEYYFFPDKIAHISLGATVGAGWLSDKFFAISGGRQSYFFALEPELNLYLNISKRHRLGIGASYLFTHGARMYEVRDEDLRNFSVSLFAQFGVF